ncbi:MAG: hypothetical protein IPI51_15695 [Betaproteobacteria bacterium]|nr:hypothetical protein [Betaproteobacteria bacterium]
MPRERICAATPASTCTASFGRPSWSSASATECAASQAERSSPMALHSCTSRTKASRYSSERPWRGNWRAWAQRALQAQRGRPVRPLERAHLGQRGLDLVERTHALGQRNQEVQSRVQALRIAAFAQQAHRLARGPRTFAGIDAVEGRQPCDGQRNAGRAVRPATPGRCAAAARGSGPPLRRSSLTGARTRPRC